ncbi:Gfo/Idh/MocA family oxidoreductase [Paenibacillus filicis]|uniref:Gfo/Idh/MocA family oxidoreductase n=1 Tax=Paenibacillus gyeongsangnamensis TaxID=3388067 RepID=A0ABT4Q776_9BACL|nr:Gfo/Idh/MocA family oxidoreductase [Paenibacillus filicis]MCZ8512684.1 Gfo/Idh/MocA family oxidoreductase [Paenibacillus filicis]
MVRFAVIGTNWITEQWIDAARELDEFALTAVYSRTEEQANAFADKHGIANRFTDLEEMARSDTFDAVYIASPNAFHANQAILCMNHGKHVLCEKPIASNTRELTAMVAAAETNGVLLMEAMKSTLMPNFRAVREHLPEIGQVRRYFASYCQYSSRYDAYKEGNVLNAFKPEFSNGALMDLGIYCIYPLVVLFGMPERIQAQGWMLGSGVDGEGSLLLKYKEMDAVIMYSKIAHSFLPAEIQGERATLVIDKINQPERVELRFRDGRMDDLTVLQSGKTMRYETEEFISLIRTGQRQSRVNSHANSLAVMSIMDEVRRQIGLVYPADAEAW